MPVNPTLELTAPSEARRTGSWLHTTLAAMAGHLSILRPAFRPFSSEARASAMRFSEHGKLFCICAPLQPRQTGPERRRVCRTCGLQIRALSRNVDRALTTAEIQAAVRNLRLAGIRSASLEIPASVMTLRQLNLYLASEACRQPKAASRTTSASPSEIN